VLCCADDKDAYEKKEHKDSKEYKEKKDDGYEKKEHKDKPKSPSSSASGCFCPDNVLQALHLEHFHSSKRGSSILWIIVESFLSGIREGRAQGQAQASFLKCVRGCPWVLGPRAVGPLFPAEAVRVFHHCAGADRAIRGTCCDLTYR
jgi:hypothetical protein